MTHTQLNSTATNSKAVSLVAAYEGDLVTEAPPTKLFVGTESLSFGAGSLSLGLISRGSAPRPRPTSGDGAAVSWPRTAFPAAFPTPPQSAHFCGFH